MEKTTQTRGEHVKFSLVDPWAQTQSLNLPLTPLGHAQSNQLHSLSIEILLDIVEKVFKESGPPE